MYEVVTASGLPVFGPDTKEACQEYIEQAIKKGVRPGFLSIKRSTCPGYDGGWCYFEDAPCVGSPNADFTACEYYM